MFLFLGLVLLVEKYWLRANFFRQLNGSSARFVVLGGCSDKHLAKKAQN
jgi:hypothetical protein